MPHAGPRRTTTIFQLLQLKNAIKLEIKGLTGSRGSAAQFTRKLFGVDGLRPQVSREDLVEKCQALVDSAHAAGATLLTPFQIDIEGLTYNNPSREGRGPWTFNSARRARSCAERKNPEGEPWIGSPGEACQVCGKKFGKEMYDAPSSQGGPWGNLCKTCWRAGGGKLGMGKGQRYVREGGKWVQRSGVKGAGAKRKSLYDCKSMAEFDEMLGDKDITEFM